MVGSELWRKWRPPFAVGLKAWKEELAEEELMRDDWREWFDLPKGEWPRDEDAAEKDESAL